MDAVLIVIYFITALISIKVSLLIFYHFKKFDLPDNEKAGRFLSIYRWGSIVLLSASFLVLMVMMIW